MVSLGRSSADGLRIEILAITVVNLLPLVGVLALGWNAAVLVTLYWFELGVLCFWTFVRAIFAGRPSEFDGDPLFLGALERRPVVIPIPRTDVGIHLSTLPVLAVVAPVLGVTWFLVGVVTVGVLGGEVLNEEALATVSLAIVMVFLVDGGRTLLEYFYRGGYREHSAQTAIQGIIWRCLGLFFVGLFATMVAVAADPGVASDEPVGGVDPTIGGVALLAGIVLVKFGFDLAGVYRDRLVAFDESVGGTIGWAYEPPSHDRVDTSLSPDHCRVRPSLCGRLLAGPSHAYRHPAASFVGVFLCVFGLMLAFSGAWMAAAGLVGSGLALSLLVLHADYWLRYAGVEYRVDDEAIVAYDRLFRTPLWRVEAWDESGVRIERDRIDRWLDTATVVIERPDRDSDRNRDRDLRLPRLPVIEPILEMFDRPPKGDAFELE